MEFVGARSEDWFDAQARGCAVQSNPAFMGGRLEDIALRHRLRPQPVVYRGGAPACGSVTGIRRIHDESGDA